MTNETAPDLDAMKADVERYYTTVKKRLAEARAARDVANEAVRELVAEEKRARSVVAKFTPRTRR